MMTNNASRREFLRAASALSIAGTATPFALNLASIGAASAQVTGGYKALVCVFLYGANDGHNTVVPYDVTNYNLYAAGRSGLAWNQATELTQIVPNNALAGPTGLQLSLPTPLAPLKTLFDAGDCAIVANVGPLIQPTTRTNFQTPGYPLPPKLFSHNDQQSVWQASAPEGAKVGWGGRIGDLLASQNTNSVFTCLNASGNAVFLSGQQVQAFQLDVNQGSIGFNALTGNTLYGSAAGASALNTLLRRNRTHLFENETVNVNTRSIDANTVLSAALTGAPVLTPPAGNSLAAQLAIAAKVIAVRNTLGAARQVFLVSLGGFDTHSGQETAHTGLLTQLAEAISWWQTTMGTLGTANDVTLFTASDFGRTLVENGDGTDHGWGSHHFVVGGAVNGKNVYGAFPDLTLNANVPTDAGNGRLIPTTSVEQYAATMAKWMGVTDANLPVILPNLNNFTVKTLGFMT